MNNSIDGEAFSYYIDMPKHLILQMFSGEMPVEGATYAHRVKKITDMNFNSTIEMQFVRIDKE